MAEDIPDALRAHFARHNRRVLLLAFASLIIVLGLWVALYFVLYWLLLLALTIARGPEAVMPPFVFEIFLISALLLCLLVALARRRRWGPPDRRPVWEIFLDVLLAVPRATVTAWSTLRAYQFLNEAEMRLAWKLLQRIGRDGRLNVAQVPAEIVSRKLQQKIVLALQLVELIDLQRADEELLLVMRERGRELSQPRVRITTSR